MTEEQPTAAEQIPDYEDMLEQLAGHLEQARDEEKEEGPGDAVIVPIPEVETTDIGDYCIECRRHVGEDTEWFASRRPHIQENEDDTRTKGFLCEPCQPLEGTLSEPIIEALVERRYDEKQIRERIRLIGEETLFEELVAPMLDMFETLLQLERK